MSHDAVIQVNEANFEREVLQSEQPVLLDFGAEWCGPCKALAPIVEQIARESAGQYKVATIDIDHSPALAAKYGIRGVPTVIVFRDGKPAKTQVGLVNKTRLLGLLAP